MTHVMHGAAMIRPLMPYRVGSIIRISRGHVLGPKGIVAGAIASPLRASGFLGKQQKLGG